MSKIFLNNLPIPKICLNIETQVHCNKCGRDRKCPHHKFFSGFEEYNEKVRNASLIDEILTAILVHDKICITNSDIHSIISLFGIHDTLKLLKKNIFQIITTGINNISIQGRENNLRLHFHQINDIKNFYDDTQEILVKKYGLPYQRKAIDEILLYIELNEFLINDNQYIEDILNELNYDLGNCNLTSNYNIFTNNINNIQTSDAIKILSLAHVNRGIWLSKFSETKNILIQSEGNRLINSKIPPSIRESIFKGNTSIDIFNNILEAKELPKLGGLYINKIMTIDEIINIRENFDGKLFRKWYQDTDYSQREVLKILSTKPNSRPKRRRLVKLIRWGYPKIVSIAEPITGILVSALDSFVLENSFVIRNIINGWHPSLFLDDKLQFEINKKITLHESKKTQILIERRLKKKIPLNKPCPCGSGSLYKRCHGFKE